MKKWIVLALLLVAAAVPAVPYLIGTTVEKNFRAEHLEAAAESALSGFGIELVDYQRQLFSATATTRLSMVPDGEEEVSFDLIHHIDHTPQFASQVIATVDTELALSDEVVEELAPLFNGEAPLKINTRIFLDGHQEGTLYSPAASGELSGTESVVVEWQGMQGSAWQAAGRDQLSFEMKMPGLIVKNRPTGAQALHGDLPVVADGSDADITPLASVQLFESLSLSDLQYSAELHKGESGMWNGAAEASIAAFDIEATDFGGEAFKMHIDRIDARGDQDESDGLVQASGAFRANRISVNGFEATNATYDAAFENLDAQALRAWQLTAAEMMSEDMSNANPFAPLTEHLPALFDAQPAIKINDISVDTPMGKFAFKMDSRVEGEWNDMLLENPALLATMIKADLEASVPRTIVISALQANVRNAIVAQNTLQETEMSEEEIEQAVRQTISQQLGGLIGQGLIRETGAQLEARVEYDAGQLTINGTDASSLLGGVLP